jgi:hypothetical protein
VSPLPKSQRPGTPPVAGLACARGTTKVDGIGKTTNKATDKFLILEEESASN